MKKFVFTFIVLCCSAFVFAQQIPQDSLEYYRQHASNLYKNLQQEEALKLFQRIAMSGDAESAYIVASIFEKLNNAQERDKWLIIAKDIEKNPRYYLNRKIAAKNTPVLQSQNPLQKSGELIELGGWQKNIGICVATIGSAIGGTMLGVGLAHGYKGFTVTGSVIIAATGLAGFVLDICGNKNIELGGKVLKEMEFSNDGINLKF